jgi:acetylglutamate kinase
MIIVKIGGGKEINIPGIVRDLAELNEKFVIVHGANALRDQLCEDLGQPKQVLTSVKGYTSVYSDEKLLNAMMMAYAGFRNLKNGYVPVLTVPIIDEQNAAINTENDDVVRVLQQALQADTVINLIEAPGFLEDKDDEASLIREISPAELETLEQRVEGRMKRKMLAVKKLFEHGATKVIISDGRREHPVSDALAGKGSVIA